MSSPCGCRAMEACCTSTCCILHHKTGGEATTTTSSSRSKFAFSAISALFLNSELTNHESIPSLQEAFSIFSSTFPYYFETKPQANLIRKIEYPHLSDQICLDYSDIDLFSHSRTYNLSSSSLPSPFFNISYKSASLKFEVQFGEQDTGFESYIKNNIMSFLNISLYDYVMICIEKRTTTFKFLAETFPFQSNKLLLTVYDYESEAITPMVECAGVRVLRAGSTQAVHSYTWKWDFVVSTRENALHLELTRFVRVSNTS